MPQSAKNTSNRDIKVFSTAPQSSAVDRESFIRKVIDVAQWNEEADCEGILIYTDNSLLDPWLIAQIVIQNTTKLCPLVAVQPAYMHPYSVAKMVSSLAHLHHRRVYLNMVAGGFKNDLTALHDMTPHDKRYARLVEYTTIIMELLRSDAAVSYAGEFYTVDKLRMMPPLSPELFPGVLVSGSSPAGLAAARALGATGVMYPQPAADSQPVDRTLDAAIRVGIIARELEENAWQVAHNLFPPDQKGNLTHRLAMKTSDSSWHRQLSEIGENVRDTQSTYWLHPFETYKTFCPYLVGSYQSVAAEVARYAENGYRTVILDTPPSKDELGHIKSVFSLARQMVMR
jgi:alkanesulfonate monooxygenase